MDKKAVEIRKITSDVSFDSVSRQIFGKVIAFRSESKNMGFYESIEPEAVTEEFLQSQDLFLLFNHEQNKVLGRNNRGLGNLHYEVREDGVYYTCDTIDNTVTRDALSYLNGGLMDGASFGFVVDPEKEEWRRAEDGTVHRTIRGFKCIPEFSIVYNPAYEATSVSCRSYDRFLEEEKRFKEEDEKREEEYKAYTDKINGCFDLLSDK